MVVFVGGVMSVSSCGKGFRLPIVYFGVPKSILRSYTMNMIMKKFKCVKCGYEWDGRVKVPKECPDCKSRNWKKGE